jgi:uncharacterized protein
MTGLGISTVSKCALALSDFFFALARVRRIAMQEKFHQLQSLLRNCGSVLVAYSGGVDSAFLAKVAHDSLGEKMLAVIADSPSLPRRELEEALALGQQFGFPVEVIRTDEMNDANYTSNPPNRCYFCKTELFENLIPLAKARGFSNIVYGENASDIGDYRPGTQAAKEFHIRAPLKEVGLTKQEIRELSAALGLPTADKPQLACLSSRIPYGQPVTEESLRMIEAAENVLRDAGFYEVRVRHFRRQNAGMGEWGNGGFAAKIEVGQDEVARLLESPLREEIVAAIKRVGYAEVEIDPQGYRRGNLNKLVV